MREEWSICCWIALHRCPSSALVVGSLAPKKWFQWVPEEEESLELIKRPTMPASISLTLLVCAKDFSAIRVHIFYWRSSDFDNWRWPIPASPRIFKLNSVQPTLDVYSHGESERILGKAIKKLNMPREKIVVAKVFYFVHPTDPGFKNLPRSQVEQDHGFPTGKIELAYCRGPLSRAAAWPPRTVRPKDPKSRKRSKPSKLAWSIVSPSSRKRWGVTPTQVTFFFFFQSKEIIITIIFVQFITYSTPIAKLYIRHILTFPIDNTLCQISLAWLFSKPVVSAPIVGIRKEKYLYDAIQSLEVKLEQDEINFLEERYQPKAISGHS